jgi:hypothetical protein
MKRGDGWVDLPASPVAKSSLREFIAGVIALQKTEDQQQ